MSANLCKYCDEPLIPNLLRCQECGRINVMPAEDADDAPVFMSLSDAPSVEKKRLCRKRWWAAPLGGGLVARQCILLGGEPGGGKSTWALMLGEACALETGKPALYLATEEAPQEIKERAKRLGIDTDCFSILPEPPEMELDCLDSDEEFSIIILDSLPDLIGDNPNDAVHVLNKLKHYSMHHDTPSLAIDHVNKGEEMAGLNRLKFKVDTTLYMRNPEGEPERIFTVIKNRFGQGHKRVALLMREENEKNPGLLYPNPEKTKKTAKKVAKQEKTT